MSATNEAQAYRQLLHGDGLRMFMQPVIDLRARDYNHVEALARLKAEDGSLVAPSDFLPLLSGTDVAFLFRRCLDEVLTQLSGWDAAGLHLTASINLDPATLREPDCAGWVTAALALHGIEPDRLELELLEGDVMCDDIQFDTFADLHTAGVRLAMDDLGAGHSSFERLSSLRFDVMKVDRALPAQLRRNPIAALAVLRSVIKLGHDSGHVVVVEGLEDAAMVETVGLLGAEYGQGYAIARPMPMRAVPTWLTQARTSVDRSGTRSLLYALAHHWSSDLAGAPHQGTLESCPVTLALDGQDLAGTDVPDWHRQQHGATFAEDASSMLVRWLAEGVRRA